MRGFVEALAYKELTEEHFEEHASKLLFDLVENDVAVDVAEAIINELRDRVVGRRLQRGKNPGVLLRDELIAVLQEVFKKAGRVDFEELAASKADKPFKVVFLGPNGHGKTTTIGKVAYRLRTRGLKVLVGAADTFRAGAIEQLAKVCEAAGVDLVSLGYGADPAAVAYEVVERARRQRYDVVLVDTAGRMHTKRNLMDEMKKITRVMEPDFKVFVGDALTGNDAVEIARTFQAEVGIDGSIVTKFDVDVKGGVVVSLVYTTGRPVLYVGTGQRLEDLEVFDYERFVKSLFEE